MLAINAFARHTPWLHAPLTGYARFGLALFAVLLLAALVVARHQPSPVLAAAGWAPLGMLLALAVNQPLGRAVAEARPYDRHPDLLVLAHRTTDFSFPSDHAVMAGAVAVGLVLVSRRLAVIGAAAAVLMAFARVYIAAHQPADVVAGLAFGGLVSWVGWLLLRRPLVAATERLRRAPGVRSAFGERSGLRGLRAPAVNA